MRAEKADLQTWLEAKEELSRERCDNFYGTAMEEKYSVVNSSLESKDNTDALHYCDDSEQVLAHLAALEEMGHTEEMEWCI